MNTLFYFVKIMAWLVAILATIGTLGNLYYLKTNLSYRAHSDGTEKGWLVIAFIGILAWVWIISTWLA